MVDMAVSFVRPSPAAADVTNRVGTLHGGWLPINAESTTHLAPIIDLHERGKSPPTSVAMVQGFLNQVANEDPWPSSSIEDIAELT